MIAGIDLAKNIFSVHGIGKPGKDVFRRSATKLLHGKNK